MSQLRLPGNALPILAIALVLSTVANVARAEVAISLPGPWDIEPFKNGYVAITRSGERMALLLFCTLYRTRNLVFAFDGRGLDPEEIPISETKVRSAPTIEVLGAAVPSASVTFDDAGGFIRLQVPLPADFLPPESGAMTIGSGPDATESWSVAVGRDGLDDSVRIAFKNCV